MIHFGALPSSRSKPQASSMQTRVIRLASHGFAHAAERWAGRKQKGLTDEDMSAAVSYEFGEGGGFNEGCHYSMKASGPTLTWKEGDVSHMLRGRNLVDAVRKVFQIPYRTTRG